MPCSCGGMRRSGLAPSNVAIRQNQPKQTLNVQQYYSPPPAPAQIQRPTQTQPQPNPQTQQPVSFQSNRPNFSGNLPRRK